LQNTPLEHLVLDCSHPPDDTPPRNHNDINQALAIHHVLQPQHTWLTHISHTLDNWLQENRLPESVSPARDGITLAL
jgi:phosphoribosyl 1,2-cyclic phosphate phosphodiesterase